MNADWLPALVAGQVLDCDRMTEIVEASMQGQLGDATMAALLTALRIRGETAEEIAGVAQAMRRQMTPIQARQEKLIDTCGTGGDGSGTFNISTAAAIVTAAAGLPVAKHGNRRASSRSGSADVLQELGVNIEAPLATVERCLEEIGLTFCFAPLWHRALKQIAHVRRELGFPTIFNAVGPLANPAGAKYQLIGVAKQELRGKLAQALRTLGTTRSIVVWGTDVLDEVSLSAPTQVSLVEGQQISELEWRPEDFGLTRFSREGLLTDTPEESAAKIREVLAGKPGAAREIVVLNAAAALWTAQAAETFTAAAEMAQQAIDSGAAREKLAQLAEKSHQV